jgi:hypothetical protein
MVGDCNDGGIEVLCETADGRNCDALEGAIEVPMIEAIGIACDARRFIAMYVISVIAVTARIVTFVLAFVVVVVRFTRGIVVMDVRMVSSAMAMIERAHDIDRMSANRK